MERKCIICKKELSSDNKGFLCQYHKNLAAEKAKKAGEMAVGVGMAVGAAAKVAYEHREEVLAAAKSGAKVVRNIVKKL